MENAFLMSRRPRLILIRSWREGRREFFREYGTYKNYLNSLVWKNKREEFLKDSDRTCDFCGKIRELEVHHKHYMSLGYESKRDVNTICRTCHENHHKGREVFDNDKIANLSDDENLSEIIFSELKKWRLKISKERKIPAYIIFHDKTLNELSVKKPSTERDLLNVNGIKECKLNKFGRDILEIIHRCKEEMSN